MKATELLKRQHRDVKKIFAQIRKTRGSDDRRDLLDELDSQLRTHMQIEEAIFYPAVRDSVQSKKIQKLVPEAYEEHHVVQLVLDELPEVDTEDETFEAKMTVLEELIDHHVEQEEKEMFPAAEMLDVETLESLGSEMEDVAENGTSEAPPNGRAAQASAEPLGDEEDLDDDGDDMEDEEDDDIDDAPGGSERRRP